MITTLCLLRALRESRKTLAEMTAGFKRYPQILLNVRVREKVPFMNLASVRAAVSEVEELLSQKGRLLLRYSGTEPLARVMIEGENQSQIEEYARRIAGAIEREIGAVQSGFVKFLHSVPEKNLHGFAVLTTECSISLRLIV